MTRRTIRRAASFACALAALCAGPWHAAAHDRTPPARQATCESLLELSLPDTTITLAQSLPAGGNPNPVGTLPRAVCRVAGTVAPKINFEVWMPSSGDWNGKFQGVGNGGLAGSISYGAMRNALGTGYATASTDTGHVSSDTAWFTDAQQTIDNGYRAIHEMTVKAKAIVRAYYGERPRFSYFNGCSTGGGQGFMEAQRYPRDYDGILAGAPNWRPTRLRAGGHVWAWVATHKDPAATIPAAKLPVMGNAVLAQCDALDGVADGVIEDPRKCGFDPGALLCAQGQDPATCLTAPQVEAVRKLYQGARNPNTGAQIFPGYARGVEFGWNSLIGGANPFGAGYEFFRWAVFRDPAYDFRNFDFDAHVALADELFGPILNADSPDLRRFARAGGKMLIYHGWADPLIPTYNTLEYYDGLLDFFGHGHRGRRDDRDDEALERVQRFARLFLIPGMGHCSGGPGTDTFDGMGALERWVEKGHPPRSIVASHLTNGVVDKTRPLCLYPKVAVYKGSGSTNDAASFVCRDPDRRPRRGHDDDDDDDDRGGNHRR
jgi:feruloyl esterase